MDDLVELQHRLITDAQAILARHLPPDGPSAEATISELFGLLDGPRWREVRAITESRPVDSTDNAGVK